MTHLRESIFVGAFRSFCTSFAAIVGALIGLALVAIGFMIISGPNFLPPKSEPILQPDAHGNRTLLPGHAPAILRLDFHGVIGMGDLTGEKIQNLLLDSRDDFLKGGRVKAILLHMNTPGGTVVDADSIYRSLLAYKAEYNVPIYAFVDGLCASGGMYIASAADKVFATPSSVIGSVGVIMGPSFNFADAMTKLGVASLTLTEGKDKDALNPFRPWKPGEEASLQAIMASLYEQFVGIVVKARPGLSKEKLVGDYGAQVYVAQEAQKLGYVDNGQTNYFETIAQLAAAGGIKETEAYQVVQLVAPHPLLPALAQSVFTTGSIKHTLDVSPLMNPAFSGKPLYLYCP